MTDQDPTKSDNPGIVCGFGYKGIKFGQYNFLSKSTGAPFLRYNPFLLKTLHLCNRVPYPPHDGGAIGIYDIISNLAAQGCNVTVLAINTPKHFQPDHVLADRARLLTVFVNTDLSPVKAFINLFKKVPYNIERFISLAYAARLEQLFETQQFDVIQIEGSHMAWCVPIIRKYSQAPVVLRAHNVEYTIWQRLAQHEQNPLKRLYLRHLASKIRAFEKEYFGKIDAIAAITPQDEDRIRELGCQTRIEIIPAGVEMGRFKIDPSIKPKPKTLFTIGSLNWLPNLEGINWFLANIWPEVSRSCPDLEWHIAGSSPPDYLLQLNLPGVKVHGFVPSAAGFMQQYDLMLAPLLSGGGMRIKIIEGMALNKCILTTNVGAEGIICRNGENILMSDQPAGWIKYLQDYATGRLPSQEIGMRAGQLILATYNNQAVVQLYLKLYRELIQEQVTNKPN